VEGEELDANLPESLAELHRMLVEWNQTDVAFAEYRSIPKIIADIVDNHRFTVGSRLRPNPALIRSVAKIS
jgi:hypothetical protein